MQGRRGRATAGLVIAFAASLTGCLTLARTATTAWTALRTSPAPDPDDAVSLLAALAGTALTGWLALSVLLSVLAAAGRAGRLGATHASSVLAAVTPRVLQRAAATALGITVVAVPAAHAATVAAGPTPVPSATTSSSPARAAVAVVDPGWGRMPTRTAVEPAAATRPAADPATVTPSAGAARPVVVVRPGDSLWRLAASALPAPAGARDVADAWPRWYAANRAVIGADPNHLEPGQRLVTPDTSDAASPSPSRTLLPADPPFVPGSPS